MTSWLKGSHDGRGRHERQDHRNRDRGHGLRGDHLVGGTMNQPATVTLEFPITDVEATEAPYWLILDPHQMMKPDVFDLSSMITGPFFSRAEAQEHLSARRHAFGKHAVVFGASGYWSRRYKDAWRKAWAASGGES